MKLDTLKKWPHFDASDISEVSKILKSGKVNRWTGGKNLEFEKKFAEYCGAKHCIALANGTLALELALEGLGVGEGDEVIVPCRTFMATASAVVMRGAKPVVVDVDENSQCICPVAAEKAITKKTKCIIAVHHAGFPCDMDAIMKLARAKKLFVIEDCAQAHGAIYKGKKVGSIAHVGAWSFCQDKIISTGGEGGAVTVNDKKLYLKMWAFKDHGRNYNLVYGKKHSLGFRWLLDSFGSNYRLTEMQAALGINALSRLEDWNAKRAANAKVLSGALKDFSCVRLPEIPKFVRHAHYKFYFFMRPEFLKKGWDCQRVIGELCTRGVPAFSGSCWNISAENCFKNAKWQKSEKALPSAAKLRDTSVMMLVHPTISSSDIRAAAKILKSVIQSAQK